MSEIPPTSSIKLLLIAYYWPPSGGMGVQRWLRMSSHLVRSGVEVHVLTLDPESAHYPISDSSLLKEVDPRVHVTRVHAFNPFRIAKKLLGKRVPQTGFSSEGKSNFWLKGITSLRSHLFIPDPRKTWNRKALAAAKAIIDEHGIQFVVTTGPPQSVHLIGHALKKSRSIHWIADFRDPWTDVFYYAKLQHSALSRFFDKRMERLVLCGADAVVTVTPGFMRLLSEKVPLEQRKKFSVITNGYEGEEMMAPRHEPKTAFKILYTGTLIESYQPEAFFESINRIISEFPAIEVRIIGAVSNSYQQKLIERFPFVQFDGVLAHEVVIKRQKTANALLLVGPEGAQHNGIVPGKLYEYLCTGVPIVYIGREDSDVGAILTSCSAGRTFQRKGHEDEMDEFNRSLVTNDQSLLRHEPNWTQIQKFRRDHVALEFLQLIHSMQKA
ncbi:MAG: glycosyltransferase [Bacteroidetes bacterium]|nr:glycosyltransferase [Bacteroidota bacterium]